MDHKFEENRGYLCHTRIKVNTNLKSIENACGTIKEVGIREIGYEELLRSTREKNEYGSNKNKAHPAGLEPATP